MRKRFAMALVTVVVVGCAKNSNQDALNALLKQYPAAAVSNSFVSPNNTVLCGEIEPKFAQARFFHAARDGSTVGLVGDTEADFQAYLSRCGVERGSSEEMRLRMRWAQLDSDTKGGMRQPTKNPRSDADYWFDVCSEAMLEAGQGIVKTAETCARKVGR